MILDATDKSIQAQTLVAPTTNDPVFSIDYEYEGSIQKENTNSGEIDENLADILSAPEENTTSEKAYLKKMKLMSITNIDTANATIIIYITDNNGPKQWFKALLEPDWVLQYSSNDGWGVYDQNGVKKNDNSIVELSGSAPNNVTVNTASTSIVAQNSNRKGLIIQNTGDEDVFLAVGHPAELNKGIYLIDGGGTWVMDELTFTTEEISGIVASGITNISVQEFE